MHSGNHEAHLHCPHLDRTQSARTSLALVWSEKSPLILAVIPQDAVETLAVAILPRFSWFNRLRLDASFAQYFFAQSLQ